MVKKIEAFEASDGSIHQTWDEAAKTDALVRLKKVGGGPQGCRCHPARQEVDGQDSRIPHSGSVRI